MCQKLVDIVYDLKLSVHLLRGLPLGRLPSTSPSYTILTNLLLSISFSFSNHLFCLLRTTFKIDSCPIAFLSLHHCKPGPSMLSLPLALDISSPLLVPVTCAWLAGSKTHSHIRRSVGSMHALYTFIFVLLLMQLPLPQ